MEFQESPNQSQEGLPVIEIKPEAERSEDIKPKVEDLGEMNEQVDVNSEYRCVTMSVFKYQVKVEAPDIKTEFICEIKPEPAEVSASKNQPLESITENQPLEGITENQPLESITENEPSEGITENQPLDVRLDQESLKRMIEEVVEDCERLVASEAKNPPVQA